MFRKNIIAIAFLFAFVSIVISNPISAHEDMNISKCSTPYSAAALKYEIAAPTWTSTHYYDEAQHKYTYGYDSKSVWGIIKTEHLGYIRISADCTITPTKQLNGRYTTGIDQYSTFANTEKANTKSNAVTKQIFWTKNVDIFLKDESGKTYLKGSSNGKSSTNTAVKGNPNNTNNSLLTTYSDEDIPTVECTKTYGDNTTKSCTNEIKKVVDQRYNGKAGQRLTCYYYEDPLTKDSDKVCTVRVYVKDVKIQNAPTTTYPGKHYNFTCKATYQDGVVRDISNEDYTFLSYPSGQNKKTFRTARYIGNAWKNGYTDPRGTKHKPDTIHDFYPVDPESRNYIVSCTYYQDYNWLSQHYGTQAANTRVVASNGIISDADKENGTTSWNVVREDEVTIKHIGIDKIWMETTGSFPVDGKPSDYVTKTLPATNNKGTFPGGWNLTDAVNNKTYSPGYWNQSNFITGHWYDFKAYIKYDNGVISDITSAPEVYWDSSPWFKNMSKHTVKNVYDSGMSKTGLDHRIPQNGWNTIDVEFLHQNVPYGKTSYGSTKSTNRLNALQIKSLEITHNDSKDKAPISVIKEGDQKKVQYKAWITWNDGTQEDWTTTATWDGDYSKSPNGNFDFTEVKGKGQKSTVYAYIQDVDDLTGTVTRSSGTDGGTKNVSYNSNMNHWDSNRDEIEVTISDCRDVEHLAWGCEIPEDYWRINFKDNFNVFNKYKDPNTNFYPDPRIFGYSSWTAENDLYSFERKFPVSGTSSGLGN